MVIARLSLCLLLALTHVAAGSTVWQPAAVTPAELPESGDGASGGGSSPNAAQLTAAPELGKRLVLPLPAISAAESHTSGAPASELQLRRPQIVTAPTPIFLELCSFLC